MSTPLKLGALFLLGVLPVIGCVIQSESHHSSGGGAGGGVAGPAGGPSASSPGSPAVAPVLVVVDNDRTMAATPGDGVGVFVEYRTGGHWHVWWTCDTNHTGQSCAFDVGVTVDSGSISRPTPERLETAGVLTAPSAQSVKVTSTTTAQAHGLTFDTTPGAVITLDAAVGGLRDESFLFFVQDGKPRGGFTGALTDPLMLRGAAP